MRKSKYETYTITNIETGETNHLLVDSRKESIGIVNKSRLLTAGQERFLENRSELRTYSEKLGGYVHMFYIKDELLFDKLNIDRANVSRLIYLSTYIDYNDRQDNLLVKRVENNKLVAMSRKDIKDVLKLGNTAFKSFISQMKKSELIYEFEKKIYLNPHYFTKGKIEYEGKDYTRVYINTTRYLYENSSSKQHKQLSYIFQLIPYLSYETNVLCYNPFKTELDDLDIISLVQLCELLGGTPRYV